MPALRRGVEAVLTPAPMPALRGVMAVTAPAIFCPAPNASRWIFSALARSILRSSVTLELGTRCSLFPLSCHLCLNLGFLVEISTRSCSRKRIEVLLPDREEDASQFRKPIRIHRRDAHHVLLRRENDWMSDKPRDEGTSAHARGKPRSLAYLRISRAPAQSRQRTA